MTDFPPAERGAYPVFLPMQTRWRDNDVYAHMNNVVFYEYFDTAVNHWLTTENVLPVPNGPLIGLVAETGCRYLAPVGFPARVEVGLSTLRVGGSSVIYGLGMFEEGAAEAAALCRFVHVYVDSKTRRPAPLPDAMRGALEGIAARG